MYTVQVDQTIQQIIEIFYRVGIWRNVEKSDRRKNGRKILCAIIGVLLPIYFAINAFICVDRNESIFSVQAAIQSGIVQVKCLYLLLKKKEILAFLYDQMVAHAIENREEYEKANKKMKKFMKLVRAFILMVFGSCVLLVFTPPFSGDRALPTFIRFSWTDSEIIYWSTYLLFSLSVAFSCIVNLMSTIIWYVMLNYSIEYQLLGKKLSNLGVGVKKLKTSEKRNNVKPAPRNKYVENLIVLIKAHQNLTGTVKRFKSCFSPLFLAQISTSGISICVSVYCLAFASHSNIFQTEMFVSILLYGMFDIFSIMYLAHAITAASDRLYYCLFESNWVEQTESRQKCVLILGEVFRQPQQLFITIYPMNLQTFTSIINGAYSMFNILKNF